MVNPQTLLLAAVFSLAAHEAGHYTAGRLLGYRCAFGFGWLGPHTIIGVDLEPGAIRGRRARLIAAAGPLPNLLILAGAILAHDPTVALVQLDMLLLASLRDYRNVLTGGKPLSGLVRAALRWSMRTVARRLASRERPSEGAWTA